MGKKSAKQVASFLGTSALTRPLFALGAASVLLGAGPAQALDANTLPQNPNVVGGKDAFSQSGSTLNVNQSTNRTVIDWRSFDIGSKAQVNFNQPGTSSIAVNRINGSTNPTDIEGGLHANGQVWILNPNGVFFGKGARVDAAGIVASTANIDDKAFMSGSNKLQMTGADHGSVENQGNISVGANGLAAFVAPSVRNSGTINATVGRVALAAGTTYTLDLAGDHLVELGLGSVKAVVDNSGKIVNPGGTIALTAKAAGQVVNSVVNVSGVVTASSASTSGGTITLGGDNVTTTSTAQLSADAGTNGNGGAITSVANVQGNYAGAFSAKGGSSSGNGGKVETSGTNVAIADGISVDTRATNGILGNWTVDPINITIGSGSDDGDTVGADGGIAASSIEHALETTSLTISTEQGSGGNGDIWLATSINATGPGSLTLTGAHLFETSASTINLGGALTLNVNAVNNIAAPTGNWINDALNMVGAVSGGTTINLGAGTYAGGTQIHANNVTLTGDAGAKIVALTNGVDAVEVFGNNVTIKGLEFAGPADQSYTTYGWGSVITRGIFIENGVKNFAITDNNIHGLRTDILVDGRNTGSITGNTIDNSKSGISVQYTDGTAYDKSLDASNTPVINITGNVQGPDGNEWGINYHLNGYWNGVAGDESHPNANPVSNGIYLANAPTLAWQQGMLAQSTANGGMSIQDQAYKASNRTSVTVGTSGSDTNQGSVLSTLKTIQAGINAVVTGGTVNVQDGTYVIPSGGANYIEIQKALTLKGQSELGTIIDARNASTYGMRVQADNVSLSNFTVEAPTALGSYGIKVEPLANVPPTDPNNVLRNFSIANVTSQGAGKTELDLNGVLGATIDHFTANGAPVGTTGSTAGSGIGLTDSANVTITNSVTENNQWGGLALYQTNTTYNQQTNNITVDGSNTFNEANPIYAEDQSNGISANGHPSVVGGVGIDFGSLHLTGFDYVVKSPTDPSDVYTWFQRTQQNAIDFAAAVSPTTAVVEGYEGDSVNGNNNFTVGTSTGGNAISINAAVNAAAADAIVNVLAGTYVISNQLVINKDLTITGDANARATINAGADFSGGGAAGAWMLVNSGIDFDLSNVIIDGTGHAINQALRSQGNTTVDNVAFRNIEVSASGQPYAGVAIESFGGTVVGGSGSDTNGSGGSASHLTVTNSMFENIGREGILVKGTGATADITGNTYTGKGAGDWLDYGIEVGAGGQATITGNTITGALGVASADDSTSAGIMVTTYYGAGSSATIQNNTVTGNAVAVDVGFDSNDTSVVNASNNNFAGNGVELESSLSTANFSGNWWGTTDATAIAALMTGNAAGSVDFSPFLMSGTDTSSATGFQGDFSNLTVTALGGGDAARIEEGVADVTTGGTVNVTSGNYTLAGTLNINKALSLIGAGEGSTIIDGSGVANYAVRAKASNISLSGFTLESGAWGGISVNSQTSSAVNNTSLSNVTIDNNVAGGAGLAITNANGVTLDHLTVNGASVGGNGVQVIDSANVALTNVHTLGNQTGLFIAENGGAIQVNNITADTTNNFADAAPVVIADFSAGAPGLGSVNIQGFQYAIGSQTQYGSGPGQLSNGQQNAIDQAVALGTTDSFIEGWTGTGVNNNFTVGVSTGGTALSINNAVGAASTGGIINVNTGTYAEDVTDAAQLTFNFGNVNVNSFTLASGGAGSSLNGSLTATGAITSAGAASLNGSFTAGSIALNGAVTLTGDTSLNASGATTVASVIGGGNDLSVTGASNTLGNVAGVGALAVDGAATLTGVSYVAGSMDFDAVKLANNAALNTSSGNGAIVIASVDGSSAGAQSLTLNAGSGNVSLGNVGATARLGAVSDASKTTLTGSTYNANSFLFGGDVTLTSANTTLNTTQSANAAGDITFQGNIFGTTDGGQSLTLVAGPGTGAASANGDITLQNAGTTAVNLNNLTVSGDNFTALTVDLAGDYNSQLTGNQVFAADTLNVKGDATSNVGGDASGHIVSGGDVNIVANGDVSGTINGQNVNLTGDDVNSIVTASNSATIQGNTVEGSYTADTVTLIASNNVNAAVNATDFTLAAQHGSVDGTWTTIDTNGSNVVSVNGQTTVGLANLNPNQLVVEGFLLPAGTRIGANGQLILPQGVLLGLLSPGGGKPKMILVHSVQQLGELLAGGYSVIVIDLSNRDSGKPIQLASN